MVGAIRPIPPLIPTIIPPRGDYQTLHSFHKTAFKPFMADLQDIKTALGNDLTPAGIDAIKKTVAQANKEAKPLKKSISKLETISCRSACPCRQ